MAVTGSQRTLVERGPLDLSGICADTPAGSCAEFRKELPLGG